MFGAGVIVGLLTYFPEDQSIDAARAILRARKESRLNDDVARRRDPQYEVVAETGDAAALGAHARQQLAALREKKD